MLLSAARNFAVRDLVAGIAATGAQALIHCKNDRVLPDLGALSDGSRLSHDQAPPSDRAGFTVARDQLIQAAGVITDTTVDLVGRIGRAVLDHLLPPRRNRNCPRVVQRAISEHPAKGTIDRTNHRSTTHITIVTTDAPP